MTIKRHHTKAGHYYQWGSRGKRYFFNPSSARSQTAARSKARRQASAAHASGYHG